METFAAAAVFAAGLATMPLHAQDPKESSSGDTMEGGMTGQDGMAGMMNMMTQMNEMMTTCNQMMQAMMDDPGKDVPGTSRDATPEDDG
jgi:hypothetical protein